MNSDAALVARYAKTRDAEAFAELFRRYGGLVYGTCLRMTGNLHDAEDLAQGCFLDLARQCETVRDSLPGWLHRVAINRSSELMRGESRRRRREEAWARAASSQDDRAQMWEQTAPHVDEAVSGLPDELRLPIILHFLQGKTQAEVAEELGIDRSTVSRRLQKGVDRLRGEVKKAGIVISAGLLAALLGSNAAHAAPARLVAAVGRMAIAGVGGESGEPPTLGKTDRGVKHPTERTWKGLILKVTAIAAVGTVLVVAVVVAVSDRHGAAQPPVGSSGIIQNEPAPPAPVEPGEPPAKETWPNLVQLALPIADLDAIVGIDKAGESAAVRRLLKSNGFAVAPKYYHQIFSPYIQENLPAFVTCDSLHRTFHVIFEEQLKRLETSLAADVTKVTTLMAQSIRAQGEGNGSLGTIEHVLLAEAYFTVAARLLSDAGGARSPLEGKISQELRLINDAAGTAQSPLFGYTVDYTQFKPRGFYTETPVLQRYFRAMTWYGNIAFRLISDDETRTAMLVAQAYGKRADVRTLWQRIDRIYSYLIGPADDLTPLEYTALLDPARRADAADVLEPFRRAAGKLRDPAINSMVIAPRNMPRWKELTKGMRFFGKRYLPDSEIFMNLTTPKVPRSFPSGLDIMAVNGSERAEELLRAEGTFEKEGYKEGVSQSRRMLATLKGAKERSHYVSFLQLVETLWEKPEHPVPSFMQTAAWRDKSLMTALAAWASMRHSWQLQAKQSVTYKGLRTRTPKGYVEPNLAFLRRLDALIGDTIDVFKEVEGPDIERLEKLRRLVGRVTQIARKQLGGEPLNANDEKFLDRYGPSIARLSYFEGNSYLSDERLPWMGLVADVHTDHAEAKTLEVATGGAMPIYVIVPHDEKLYVMVGGVYSYHEFLQPIGDRLTDAGWRNLLEQGRMPPMPTWTASFIQGYDVDALMGELSQGKIVPQIMYVNDPRIAVILKKELEPGGAFQDAKARAWAIRTYGLKAGRDGVQYLFELLNAQDNEERRAAASALSAVADERDLPALKDMALNADRRQRLDAIRILGQMRAPAVKETLIDLLRHTSHPDSVDAILRILRLRGSKDMTPHLLALWPEANENIRSSSIETLATIWQTQGRRQHFGNLFPSTLAPDQEEALRAQVGKLVLEALNSPNKRAWFEAMGAVPKLGLKDAVPRLEEIANEKRRKRGRVIDMLWRLNTPEARAVLRRLLARHAKDDPNAASKIASHFGQLDDKTAPLLYKLLDDRRNNNMGSRVCDEAMMSLAKVDRDGPRFWRPHGDAEDAVEKLRQAWLTYAAIQGKGGLGKAGPKLADRYVELLMQLIEVRVQYTGYGPVIGVHWARSASEALAHASSAQARALAPKVQQALVTQTRREVKWILELLEKYYKRDFGVYPPESPGHWERVVEDKRYVSLDHSRLDKQGRFCDAWGNPYRYHNPARHTEAPIEVYSLGPNGKDDAGKGDDIVSWEPDETSK